MIAFRVDEKPISVNQCYGQNKNGRRYMTDEGKAFKELIYWKALKTLSNLDMDFEERKTWERAYSIGKFHVTIKYFFDSNRHDIDNSNKLILDAMQKVFYKNDNQIFKLVCLKEISPEDPHIEIMVDIIT